MTAQHIDLICFSHLRWGFVFQRPQHLITRFARDRRVFFIEEPVFEKKAEGMRLSVVPGSGVRVYTPVLPLGLSSAEIVQCQKQLLNALLIEQSVVEFVSWYYTPMAREFSRHLSPQAVVYDCMDELSAFAGAPAAMKKNEQELFEEAHLVFTGGASLYQSKRKQHASVHLFPSSVDVSHFAKARSIKIEPEDQRQIPHPRLGYAGVIDERMDLQLLSELAARRPDWHFVFIGPIVKINAALLPKADNIHYLGMKHYSELPAYFSGWKIGMLPFALNESTRYISPTKTPEYLAAGMSVISTPIRDVVNPYGDLKLVGIGTNANDFIRIAESFLQIPPDTQSYGRVDAYLSQSSWDKTWSSMNTLIETSLAHEKLSASRGSKTLMESDRASEGAAHV